MSLDTPACLLRQLQGQHPSGAMPPFTCSPPGRSSKAPRPGYEAISTCSFAVDLLSVVLTMVLQAWTKRRVFQHAPCTLSQANSLHVYRGFPLLSHPGFPFFKTPSCYLPPRFWASHQTIPPDIPPRHKSAHGHPALPLFLHTTLVRRNPSALRARRPRQKAVTASESLQSWLVARSAHKQTHAGKKDKIIVQPMRFVQKAIVTAHHLHSGGNC